MDFMFPLGRSQSQKFIMFSDKKVQFPVPRFIHYTFPLTYYKNVIN